MESVLYVGIDVHKDFINIGAFRDNEQKICIEIQKKNDPIIVKKYFLKLKEKGTLLCCYEAGFSGFALFHLLKEIDITCLVIAPGLIPQKPGERVKTNRKDAEKLALNLRAGTLTPIHIPTVSDEATRDFLRMRDAFKDDEKRRKQQILSFIMHLGLKYTEGKNWTGGHRKWLKNLSFEHPLQRETLNEYLNSLAELEEKLILLEHRIEEIAYQEEYKSMVGMLMCFKGIGALTGLSLVTELGDFKRFETAEKMMGFFGLVPSEYSSGHKRNQGGITKAGNSRLRKLLIEAAWHYRFYQPSKRLVQRRKGFSSDIVSYADKAGRRLSRKYQRMIFNGKPKQKAVTAVARELCGFIWGMANDKIA
ncbi:MAG: IS110 family transposase [Spirochaetales bacterium]|nr:IS110 family transposase [Spirochaetales bacterium]